MAAAHVSSVGGCRGHCCHLRVTEPRGMVVAHLNLDTSVEISHLIICTLIITS